MHEDRNTCPDAIRGGAEAEGRSRKSPLEALSDQLTLDALAAIFEADAAERLGDTMGAVFKLREAAALLQAANMALRMAIKRGGAE